MQHLVEFLLVGLSLASAYPSKFDDGNSIDRPTSQDASISNIFKRSKRAAPDIENDGSTNMHFQFGDSSVSNVIQNIENHGSGDIFETYGDCSAASIFANVKIIGSGDLHLVFGTRGQRSNASTSGVPSNANDEWPRNVISRGSGDTNVEYGNCIPSSSRVMQIISVIGSGDIRIHYNRATNSKMDYNVNIVGSGDVYVECNGATSNVRSYGNSGEKLGRHVVIIGSGKFYTTCGNSEARFSIYYKESDSPEEDRNQSF